MITVLKSLNDSLHRVMTTDERVLILGEDILDPYGGAFKVTQGLSDAFPDRVISAPISEAGFVGIAAGMALRGLRPVVEIMFGDFVTLATDQIINHIAKFRWMYNDQVRVPIVIRTPMGGRRGYGPTHSQTLEKLFLGVPGLKVLAPTALGDPGQLLAQAIADDDPILFVENKLLYLARLHDEESLREFDFTPTPRPVGHPPAPLRDRRGAGGQGGEFYSLTLKAAPPPVLTIAAYGYMTELARQAMLELAYEHEVFAELIVPTQLYPFEIAPILDSVRRTGRLLAVEEGTLTLGWGAEILARISEEIGPGLLVARRVAARDLPVPASGLLEESVLPGVEDIVHAARKMV